MLLCPPLAFNVPSASGVGKEEYKRRPTYLSTRLID